jgi:hypothetical protein
MGLHPNLLVCVGQLLGVGIEELRLLQHTVTAKFGFTREEEENVQDSGGKGKGFSSEGAGEQPLHQDFGNNSLLIPARGAATEEEEGPESEGSWLPVEELQAIVYYSEGAVGPTAFLPGLRNTKPAFDGEQTVEMRARYNPGTILLYQLGTWHRGTRVETGACKLKHHLSFRTKEAEWVGGSNSVGQPSAKALVSRAATDLAAEGAAVDLESVDRRQGEMLARLSASQRAVLGFPPVGSDYWTAETVQATAARYQGALGMAEYTERPRL